MTDAERKLSPEGWVEEHGNVLFRYALARVRSREVAEDLWVMLHRAVSAAHGEQTD